jgi:hypothetical protein
MARKPHHTRKRRGGTPYSDVQGALMMELERMGKGSSKGTLDATIPATYGEAMKNKIKCISHRSFRLRTAENFITAIHRC